MNREYVQVSDRIILRTDKGLKTMRNYDNIDNILVMENKVEKTINDLKMYESNNEELSLEKIKLETFRNFLYATSLIGTISIVSANAYLKYPIGNILMSCAGLLVVCIPLYKQNINSISKNDEEIKNNNISIEENKMLLFAQKKYLEQLKEERIEDNTKIINERYTNVESLELENEDFYNNKVNDILKLQLKKEN